jgi:hypothetical protein
LHCIFSDNAQENLVKKGKNVKPSPKGLGSHVVALVLDYVFVILPILLFFTALSEWCYQFASLVILVVLFRMTFKRSEFHSKVGKSHFSSFRNIITSYRVSVVSTKQNSNFGQYCGTRCHIWNIAPMSNN